MDNGQVLCLGEALVDVVARGDEYSEHPGGSVLNVACGLAQLEHPVSLAAWWGRDRHGHLIEEAVRRAGVEILPGSDGAERTSVAHATLDAQGKARYQFDLSYSVPRIDPTVVDHLHTGSIAVTVEPGGSQVVSTVRQIRQRATISYDPNARPTIMGSPAAVLSRIEEVIGLCDLVKASDEDLAWLYPDATVEEVLRYWTGLGPTLVVCTRGPAGATALLRDNRELLQVGPIDVPVADTVGAGDSFMAGMVSGLLSVGLLGGLEARQRLRSADWSAVQPALHRAIITSGITVSHAGAYGPTLAEVHQVTNAGLA